MCYVDTYLQHRSNGYGVGRLGIPVGMEKASTEEIWRYLSDHTNTPTWTFLTDPDEIDRRLWEWQYYHYNQADETPMATSQWHSILDPQDKTDAEIEEIMNGTIFSESDLPKEAKLFFQHLTSKIQPPLDPSKIEINKEVFQSFYKGARESTSSSPSKLHLGHWKAASYDDDISTVLSMIIQIAVANEYPLRRWQTIISVLLEKMSGKPYLHKFRTIHLVESDFNFVLRYIWGKQFMRHNISTLHVNQYGGRSGIQGQSAALNKTLTMDIIRYYSEPAALVDNDAQACYDRLIPVVLSYALIRLGLPPHLTRFMCKWLENSEYYLKLSHGLSKHSYSTTLDKYLFGTGQGTGWSPPNWSAISDIISNAMEEHTPGMFLQHPNNVTFSSRSYDAFVDDVNGGLTQDGMKIYHPPTSFSVPLLDTIFAQIQANIQCYARLLFTSGGKLALHKCFCYILEFEWKAGKKSMVQTANKYPPLQIDQTFQNKPNQITLLNPSTARKMLGAIAAPDGSTKAQFEALQTKARHWGQKIKTSYLNRYDATMSLRQGILKSLEYPLGVSLLSAQQCYDILVPVLTPYLNKISVNSKTPRTIVHGPIEHAGFQIPDLYTSQGMQKIQLLLGHMRKQDTTGEILNIAMAIAQQEVGITIPILVASYKKYNFLLSHSWIKCMWLFLYQIEATIVVPDVWTPSPCYANDVNIMEQVVKWDLPIDKIKDINLSRLYMRVYFVGELLDTSKTRLKNGIRLFRPNNYHNDKFPAVPKLPKRFQEIWTYTINRLVSETPLGNFLGSLRSSLSIEWSISESMLYLFKTQKNNKLVYGRLAGSSNKIMFSSNPTASPLSASPAYAVTVTPMTHSLRVQHPILLPSPPPSPPVYDVYPLGLGAISSPTSATEIKTFQQRLDSIPPAYQSILGQIQSISYVREIALAIHRKKAIGVGDASVAFSRGGHAYILETKPAQFHLHGVAPVHCVEEDITSNRSEGFTVLAMLILVHQICLQYQINDGEITIYCDNAEALRRKHIPTCTYTKLSSRDDDVKMELYHLLKRLPIQVHLCHVSGHADSDPDFDYDSAPQQVQRNIDMHNAVTAFMQNHPPHLKPTSKTTFLPNQKAGIYIQGQLITGNLKHHVLLQRHAHSLEKRLSTHHGVPSKFQHVIDWKGLHLAMKNKNPAERVNVCKIIHGLWPTATALESRGKGHSNACMRCNLAAETPQHVFQCSSRMAKAAFRESIQGFRKKLKKMKVSNPLVNVFVEFFLAHHENRKPKVPKYSFGNKIAFSLLKRAFSHQLLLETNVFHLGYVSYKWSVVHRHYQDRESKSKHMSEADVSWSAKLIAAIWTCSHSIWSKRCAQIHKKDKTADESLCSEELKSSIRSYLRLPRHDLSSEEKVLHLNVSRHLCKAYHTTLARWLHLLATERAHTIQSKRKDRIGGGGLQPLTKFFRLNASRNIGNLAS